MAGICACVLKCTTQQARVVITRIRSQLSDILIMDGSAASWGTPFPYGITKHVYAERFTSAWRYSIVYNK